MNTRKAPQINEEFTNKNNQHFDKVREIAFKKGELFGNLGTYITETRYDSKNYFVNDRTNGVYIYQSFDNPNVAYRVYKTFNDYGFNGHNDERLIQKLMERQSDIQKTSFPTGVITLDGNVIGQEIPFYNGAITLLDYAVKNKVSFEQMYLVYVEILNVLKEMSDNGIYYLDVHEKNFMLNPSMKDVKVHTIDFDYFRIAFEEEPSIGITSQMFNNYRYMVDGLNENFEGIDKYPIVRSFDEAYYELDNLAYKVKQKTYKN